jgi:hypothetical protein
MVVRWIRRAVLWWIISLVALLAAADFGLRVIAQYVVARQLQTSLALQERPKVSFGGWPFLPELVSGDLASVTVQAQGTITRNQFPAQSVDVTLQDVSFSLGDLVSGGRGQIAAKTGDGTITMTEQDINAALANDLGVTVNLKNGKVLLKSILVKGSITADVSISNGELVLSGDQLPAIKVALPEIAQGLTFTDVTVSGNEAILTFSLKNAAFQT